MLFYLIPSHWFLLISHIFSGNLPVTVTIKPRNTFPPCGKDGSIQFEIKVDIKPEDVDNCKLLLCNSILWNLVCFCVNITANFNNWLCLECVKYHVVTFIRNYWEPGAGKEVNHSCLVSNWKKALHYIDRYNIIYCYDLPL